MVGHRIRFALHMLALVVGMPHSSHANTTGENITAEQRGKMTLPTLTASIRSRGHLAVLERNHPSTSRIVCSQCSYSPPEGPIVASRPFHKGGLNHGVNMLDLVTSQAQLQLGTQS